MEFQTEELTTGISLRRYISYAATTVNIPKSIDGKQVIAIGDSCFFGHDEIEHVTFPSTLTAIGDSAFALCKGIQELILPDGVTEIGACAFRDCIGLKKIYLPANLKRLRSGVFSYCHLRDIELKLPSGLEIIESYAFYSGGHFDLVIPESVTQIGVGAFNWGPLIKTTLPYDKGWYLDWPYGETIANDMGMHGVISDIRPIGYSCMILTVEFDSGCRTYFYPSFGLDQYMFIKPENQAIMTRDLVEHPDACKIYEAWQMGLI